MKSKCFSLLAGLCLVFVAVAQAAATGAGFAGQWTIDVPNSTPIRPWDHANLTITVNGDEVVIKRDLAWGPERRAADTTKATADGKTVTANPVDYWLDTWYTNVYIGGDHRKHVVAKWLDGGRILALETDLTLEAQQGDQPVHIHTEYRLSPDGRTLRVFELRSTRDQALVYVFNRS